MKSMIIMFLFLTIQLHAEVNIKVPVLCENVESCRELNPFFRVLEYEDYLIELVSIRENGSTWGIYGNEDFTFHLSELNPEIFNHAKLKRSRVLFAVKVTDDEIKSYHREDNEKKLSYDEKKIAIYSAKSKYLLNKNEEFLKKIYERANKNFSLNAWKSKPYNQIGIGLGISSVIIDEGFRKGEYIQVDHVIPESSLWRSKTRIRRNDVVVSIINETEINGECNIGNPLFEESNERMVVGFLNEKWHYSSRKEIRNIYALAQEIRGNPNCSIKLTLENSYGDRWEEIIGRRF